MRGRDITLVMVALGVTPMVAPRATADPPPGHEHHDPSPSPSASPAQLTTPIPTPSDDPSTTLPGNNGVVKIDAKPFDEAPDNEPHVGCAFQIDFFGFDQGNLWATYQLDLHSPTGSGTLETGSVFIGEDPAGGATDFDNAVTIDLMGQLAASGVQPQPNQGYHVRLNVNAQGSIGADTKHKMLWVTCGAAPATTTPPTSVPTVLPTTVTPAPPTVLPTTITPPPSTGPLAFTGDDSGRRLFAALALLLFGSAALRASNRKERRHYHR